MVSRTIVHSKIREKLERLAASQFEAVELLKTFCREYDLFWLPNGVFVTITGILLGAFAVFSRLGLGAEATITLSLLGLPVSLAWVHVYRMSKHYYNRLAEDLNKTLGDDEDIGSWFKTLSRGHTIAQILAVLSILLWISLGVYGALNIRWSAGTGLPPGEVHTTEQLNEAAPAAEDTIGTPGEIVSNSIVSSSFDAEAAQPAAQRPTLMSVSTNIKFSVQVCALQTRQRAERVRALLQDGGYTAYVVKADVPGLGRYYRVQVGPFDTVEKAREAGLSIRNRFAGELPDFWIVPFQQ